MAGPFAQTDHVAAALARLPAQFATKTNITKLIGIIGRRANLIEQQLQALSAALGSVAGALQYGSNSSPSLSYQNWWLERFGQLVGEPRNGRNDLAYSTYISVRIALNRSSGTPNDIYSIFQLLLDNPLVLREQYPAAFELYISGALPEPITPADASAIVLQAKGAGVGVQVVADSAPLYQMLIGDTVVSGNPGGTTSSVSDGIDGWGYPEGLGGLSAYAM